MRLDISIEISADEIPAATELLRLIKSLSSNPVKAPNSEQAFRALLSKLVDPSAADSAAADILKLLEVASDSDEIFVSLFNAFVEVVFPRVETPGRSVIPFFAVLFPRLADAQRIKLRDRVVPYVIKQLTLKRSIDCNRAEFFPYAEAFASLVKLACVSIPGAVATMTALISKPETRAAGVTMLGKTVELCLDLLKAKCDPVKLKELADAVRAVTEPVFAYDINYIEENMNGTNVLSPTDEKVVTPTKDRTLGGPRSPPVVAAQPAQRLLLPTASFSSHKNTIFALAYDDVHDRIMSAGKDGLVMVWGKAGVPEQEITLSRHYACAMDFNGRYSSLFVGGVAKEPSVQPALFHYTSDNKGRWELRGTLERPGRLVSCVKALIHDSRANHLVAGESCKPEQKHSISVYDVSSGLFEKLQPLMSYEEHSDIITSIAQVGGSEGLFFSASRDCSIKLWDLRQRSSSGAFSSPKGVGHDAMITCLDVQDRLLLSAGLDKRVCAWDLRMLGNSSGAISAPMQFFAVDSSPVLKVAICPAAPNFAAVSTLESFRLLKLDSGVSDQALPFKDGRARGRYHDLRWNGTSDVLYASGEGMQVDVYQFI